VEATGRALDAVTAQDAWGFFGHCGYRLPSYSLAQPLYLRGKTLYFMSAGWMQRMERRWLRVSSVERYVERSRGALPVLGQIE
jgi:hypothetical protein